MSARVAQAYDGVADVYDEQMRGDAWIRDWLWGRYEEFFRPGMTVVDVGCGSGSDAIWLARRGIRVTGVDPSPRMLARLASRATSAGVGVPTILGDEGVLRHWEARSVDGIVSAFAALNTVPDLHSFAADAARVVRPGGWMVLHLLNPFSLWEWLGLIAAGRWRAARGLGRNRTRTFVIGGIPVTHHLRTAAETYAQGFGSTFDLHGCHGLGILRPPANVRHLPDAVQRMAGRWEDAVRSRRPLRDRGRFFVLELQRRADT